MAGSCASCRSRGERAMINFTCHMSGGALLRAPVTAITYSGVQVTTTCWSIALAPRPTLVIHYTTSICFADSEIWYSYSTAAVMVRQTNNMLITVVIVYLQV